MVSIAVRSRDVDSEGQDDESTGGFRNVASQKNASYSVNTTCYKRERTTKSKHRKTILDDRKMPKDIISWTYFER